MLLAWDPETTAAVLERGLIKLTPSTVTDPVRFTEELAQVRERGYAVSVSENAEGVASVGAPVRDSSGRVIAVLVLGGPTARVKKPDIPLAWPTYVAVSDRWAYVADTVNRRVVRVKLNYAAEETCSAR